MNNPHPTQETAGAPTPEEFQAALFAHLIIQQSSMAMMLLGKTAHPETGKVVRDLEAAKLFIDQLEMLEVKTRGNLNSEEAALLKQTLMSLRMAFVEAVDAPAPGEPGKSPAASPPPAGTAEPEAASTVPAPEAEEQRKKFTKKY